jgi:hypothetical protein
LTHQCYAGCQAHPGDFKAQSRLQIIAIMSAAAICQQTLPDNYCMR